MKCHPLRWLWGLLPLAVWAWITVLSERPRIENDLTVRTQKALDDAGFSWAGVNFSGRDGLIGGKAQDDSEANEAITIANRIWGVRNLEAQTELIRKVDTYVWSAERREGGIIRITGHVPNFKTRKQMQDIVKAQFPKAEIEDRTEFARGAPPLDTWIAGIRYGVKQLAGLKKGHVDLTNTDFGIGGEADTAQTYQGIKTALRTLPGGVKLVTDRVTPPTVTPYVFAAQSAGSQVTLTGYVPSEKTHDDIVAHAKSVFAKVTDQLQYADGAPEGMTRATVAALDQLARLKDGRAELKAHTLALSGHAADEATADLVRAAFKKAVPVAFKTSETLQYPVAPPPPPVAAEVPPPPPVVDPNFEAKRLADLAEQRRRDEDAEAARRRQAEDDAKRQAELARQREADEARRQAEDKERARIEQRKADADRCQQELRSIGQSGVIRFARASADLTKDSAATLDKLAKAANACPGFIVEIEGHTDAEGTPERNQALSERRARSVLSYMRDAGVETERLRAVGYGETQPIAPNDTPENRARNRRIEFAVKPN